MRTVKFNEEEIELLIALYEDELKEAGLYTDKLKQTLNKLKQQAETAKAEPVRTGKKRGRKPKIQTAVAKPVTGKKRGRKPKVQEAAAPVALKADVKKAPRKKKGRKTRKQVVSKAKSLKTPVIQKPVAEEIKPV